MAEPMHTDALRSPIMHAAPMPLRADPPHHRIATLAAYMLDTPTALISLWQDGALQVAGIANPTAPRMREAALAATQLFCARVIAQRSPLVVGDVANHADLGRFQLDTELQVRAYIGVPILNGQRRIAGVLCAMDVGTRDWGSAGAGLLSDLAAGITTEIELANERALRDQEAAEREQMQSQLAQLQSLASLGQLTGNVAHDFNNTLTTIAGYTFLLEESMPSDDPRHDDLQQIVHAVRHGTALTRQLLTVVRNQASEPQLTNMNALILGMQRLLERALTPQIEMSIALADSLPPVLVDPPQLERVLLNLVVNARDAMPEGGRLMLSTEQIVRMTTFETPTRDLAPGRYVLLHAADTGAGVAPELQSRIFEPFFTTKEVGKGTGLGLAVCHGIVRRAGGHIWVTSEPGQGATFTIALPVASACAC
jgi:signal transduction histidine kinase